MFDELLFETDVSDVHISVIADRPSFRLCDHMARKTATDALLGIHQHSFYELFFVPDDCISIVTEDGARVFENKAVIIPPATDHYVSEWAKEGYCLIFAIESAPKKDGGIYGDVCALLGRGISAFEIDGDMRFYMEKLASVIASGRTNEGASHVIALLFMSFFKSLRLPEGRSDLLNLKYRNYINTLDQYISKHYAEQIRIDDIAEELHLCSKQVSRIINKEYGMSLSRVVHRHRMSVARMLLRHTSLSLSQIAESVGYEYENYFFRMFKDMYGMTPTEYREGSADRIR
ncbi:MAG: helix-turn-helix transcriptional regulator [Clostridia bacterium]|nr:helix-turn-helix transcriptional regulator [Clostridia bacterium]